MDGNKESKHKNKADEIERNMQIYGDSSVYLGRFLFPLPQTQFIFELTHTILSVKTWWALLALLFHVVLYTCNSF